jgi:hypothetical protein
MAKLNKMESWKGNRGYEACISNYAIYPSVIKQYSIGYSSYVSLYHYPSRTYSIKPSLKFSSYFVVINTSEGSLFLQKLYITTAGVKCCVAVVKKYPYYTSVLLYFFLKLRDHWVLGEAEGCCTYSLSLMYKLNQTESEIFM